MRRNPLLFKHEEFEFLHKVYLSQQSNAKPFISIQKKCGVGLSKDEILFVKKKFSEWKLKNPEEFDWDDKELQ